MHPDTYKEGNKPIGSVMVVGGGIGGIQSALDLAEAGFKVYLIEQSAAIGGKMARLDKTFPTNDCSMCILSPKLVDCGRHHNIEIMTGASVQEVTGSPGHFTVRIHQKSLFVDQDICTGCGECAQVCPVSLPDTFNESFGERRAIYKLYPQAIPNAYSIEKRGQSPCVLTCPAHCNVQGYVALLSQGKFQEALDVIRRQIPFPGICGRICHHPCEGECNRQEYDEPVSIRALKRAASDYGWTQDPVPAEIEEKEGQVAVVGAGPAGLTAALDLRLAGYSVVVFDALPEPGGTMYSSIPRYRLPDSILRREIHYILNHGIEFRGGIKVGEDISFGDLQKDYHALLLAVGAVEGRTLSVPGVHLAGIMGGLDFLQRINQGQRVDLQHRVLVIGGGNVAIDTARSALREGASEVHLFCLEARQEMPAHAWEIEEAVAEGVVIHPSIGPSAFLDDGKGQVKGVEFLAVASVFDEEGRFNPTFVEGSKQVVGADRVLISIGQSTDLIPFSTIERKKGPGNRMVVDDITLSTGLPGVFAAGDAIRGPSSVVEAIADGHEAAISIIRYLEGEELATGRGQKEEEHLGPPGFPVQLKPRLKEEEVPPPARRGNYGPIQNSFTREEAIEEASRCLHCALCSECLQCLTVCEKDCIHHQMATREKVLDVGALILSPGNDLFAARSRGEYGYGVYENVITSMEFERMLSASGPFAGEILRLSDQRHPDKIAFIQCVGSRDTTCNQGFCSTVCCMYSTKEAIIAKEHQPGLDTTIFYLDMRAFGKGFDDYLEKAREEYGVKYRRSLVAKVVELQKDKRLRLKYYDEAGEMIQEDFDLVVLAMGMTPPREVEEMASKMGIRLNSYHFCHTQEFTPSQSSREGIFVSGSFAEPKDIPETVTDASSAAALASAILAPARHSMTVVKEYPVEVELGDEIRVGVFICHCGRNIGSVVDVPAVVEDVTQLPDVVHAEHNLYTCSQDSLEQIKKICKEKRLNRVVVASCTPRTHEPLYQETIREAGLNAHLFEMANIREQVSWVHMLTPEEATEKAKVLVRMAVARARLKEPIYPVSVPVRQEALIIGGGLAGMTAALNLARQGFPVHLVEREEDLGGNLRLLYGTLKGSDPKALLHSLKEEIKGHDRIHLYLGVEVEAVEGYIGNYLSHLQGQEKTIQHGVILVATGAQEIVPQEYLYGQSPRVMTQLELEKRLHDGHLFQEGQTYVMIQCVGSREERHPYCSRICCSDAIKNALHLKEKDSRANIIILYRDIRTYGFREDYYLKARREGILFVQYREGEKPEVIKGEDCLRVCYQDLTLNQQLEIPAHYVILSSGMEPRENRALAKTLKIPTTGEGFFLEAHVKLRPVDFAAEGIYLCGLAHSPRDIGETITQAQAAAMRASTILSQDTISSSGTIATVKERLCTGCGICVDLCPYAAREVDAVCMVARVNDILCQGCGACVSGCPSGASRYRGFQREEILAMVEEAF